jgi:Cys-rich repeat protein
MDERRFDQLTKSLVATKPSRREALRRFAGGALATVFGSLALEGASAQVGIEAKTCGQVCTDDGQCNAGLQCGAASEECFAIPDTRDNCDNNGDCTSTFETCSDNGKCVNTVAPSGCDECDRNGDCEDAGRICSNHRCIVPECTDNSDCPHRRRCRNGRCVRRN